MTRIPTTTLTLTRTIAATPAEVFDVWMDPASPGGPWFGASRVIFNGVVDGLFYHVVHHEGHDWAHYGRFVRLDKPTRIEHTWMSEATKGLETTLTLSFAAVAEGTEVTLRHDNVPDDAMGRQHEDGWEFCLGALEARFAKRSK